MQMPMQANATGSVQELKLSSNYITKIGQVALIEAVDMVYDMSGKVMDGICFPCAPALRGEVFDCLFV